uniref:Uncharacterized protein n=1 Tax=Minutocellus polymorphus TaxID=265543 RepID=A0A7S0AZC8_9STRA|mmetsp:Transcript_7052/g.11755  ORF Transcript_7052/g.11755 Transcript_7052/m.11755 type:complete len:369 (+) Transcript_7052:100-1206(+)|eukprot:CAMPEP_0197718928 /NCGR_PEP_ID=MMETSP1434-20131217/2886_1 /TAXON_ID=265543 /ORGANISM="Minutocellus polymorphus, Strain CCMP3303" /LENGTH=368 /DNA_ID=CAMNT_0043303623 /DNA_START=40 /DNA_END=1146 /DNA_ORIENTATION=+
MVRVGPSRDGGRSWLRIIPCGIFAFAGIVGLIALAPEFESSLHTKLDLQETQLSRIAALLEEQKGADAGNAIISDNASSDKSSRQKTPNDSGRDKKTFLDIALTTGTDKVAGQRNWDTQTFKFEAVNPRCRTWGHFYHEAYQKWLEPMAGDDVEPFQFLEIGFSNGDGFEAFTDWLPQAEMHSMELYCEFFDRKKNKPWHKKFMDSNRFHCGDASEFNFSNGVWTTHMKRSDAPPLRVVVDDASHKSEHQAASVFFWFPRIEPGGIMIVEDIQGNTLSNEFRHEFLPQIMADLHFCGIDPDRHPGHIKDTQCFPTLQPLLKSVECEMHICVFRRNELPAVELDKSKSSPPSNALSYDSCKKKKMKPKQ